jgi:hypothetical protein
MKRIEGRVLVAFVAAGALFAFAVQRYPSCDNTC